MHFGCKTIKNIFLDINVAVFEISFHFSIKNQTVEQNFFLYFNRGIRQDF